MARIVQKFGGTSVKDAQHILKVAEIITREASQGNEVTVVVSAMGHTTDDLIALANKVSNEHSAREMDMLLSTGEQISIALLAMAVQARGFKARSLTGWQAGVKTDNQYGQAHIKHIETTAIEKCLQAKEIPIVAGFQGIADNNEIATLGRGGSDTTAVALAAALKAEWCDIYTDVNGIYTVDPRTFADAKRLSVVSYEEMLELAASGAQVLNPRSVETAMNMQVPVRLRSTFEPEDMGTLVTNKLQAPDYTVCGIACDANDEVAKISVVGSGINGKRSIIAAIFETLCNAGIPAQMQTVGDLKVMAIVPVHLKQEAVKHIHEKFCIFPADAHALVS